MMRCRDARQKASAVGSGEQRIAQLLAHFGKCVTRGGLGHADLLRRLRNAARPAQLGKQADLSEIKLVDMHVIHRIHERYQN